MHLATHKMPLYRVIIKISNKFYRVAHTIIFFGDFLKGISQLFQMLTTVLNNKIVPLLLNSMRGLYYLMQKPFLAFQNRLPIKG